MKPRSITPRAWWQVGLAVLPGVMFLAMSFVGDSLGLSVLITVLVLLLTALWTMGRWQLASPPVWGYIPLGLVAFVALEALVAMGMVLWSALVPGSFEKSSLPGFIAVLSLVAVAVFFLVKDSGLCAGLIVLSAGVPWMGILIEQVIYFYDNPFWKISTDASVPALFFIASPFWVMRSRSMVGQVAGLILPAGLYGALLVVGLIKVREFTLAQSLSIAEPAVVLFAIMFFVGILYSGRECSD